MTFLGKAWKWNEADHTLAALSLSEHKVSEPAEDEIVVANTAIALNPVDWKKICAVQSSWKNGHIPGVDGAGIVVAAGSKVTLPLGTRVAYHQDLARDGSFAEYTTLAAYAALVIPTELSDAVAASLPCPALTAWQSIEKIPTLANQDVLVIGGGGAVGRLLLQMAIERGFRTWTTASPQHEQELLQLGAAGVFDYHNENWREALQKALGGRKLFAAFDTMGEANALTLEPLVGFNSHIVCIQGRINENAAPAFTKAISQHEVALNSIYGYGNEADWRLTRAAAARILHQAAIKTLSPSAIVPFAFEALPDALASLKEKKISGKFVAKSSPRL